MRRLYGGKGYFSYLCRRNFAFFNQIRTVLQTNTHSYEETLHITYNGGSRYYDSLRAAVAQFRI